MEYYATVSCFITYTLSTNTTEFQNYPPFVCGFITNCYKLSLVWKIELK